VSARRNRDGMSIAELVYIAVCLLGALAVAVFLVVWPR
jgi:hypothetical protein